MLLRFQLGDQAPVSRNQRDVCTKAQLRYYAGRSIPTRERDTCAPRAPRTLACATDLTDPARRQLGVLFFVASMTSLVLGLSEYLSSDKLMRRQAGFVYSGWSTRILVTSIGGLALATCVLLLVAKEE